MLQELQLGRPVEHQPAGKIIQVIDAMPGSVVPLAMFYLFLFFFIYFAAFFCFFVLC